MNKPKDIISIASYTNKSIEGLSTGAEASKIMGIDILDHTIITKNKVFSFKENKLIK